MLPAIVSPGEAAVWNWLRRILTAEQAALIWPAMHELTVKVDGTIDDIAIMARRFKDENSPRRGNRP